MDDFVQKIQMELDRLDHLPTRRAVRDRTIQAVAQAAVDGKPIVNVLGSSGVVSIRTYYDTKKHWIHDPIFKDVLEKVTTLYRQRDAEIKATADEQARRQRHQSRAELLAQGRDRLADLLDDMETAGQTPAQVGSFMNTVMNQERSEFGDEPAQRVEVTVDGGEKVKEMREKMRSTLEEMRAKMLASVPVETAVNDDEDDEENAEC